MSIKRKNNQSGYPLNSVTTEAINLILRDTPSRLKLTMHNTHATAKLYLSYSQPLPHAFCITLMPNEKWVDDGEIGEDALYCGTDTAGAILVIIETVGVAVGGR